jgi:serine/threonine protein kinase
MVGKKLSHHKITAQLSRGGMGIVCKAEDTRLDRTIAIKVLPSSALSSMDDRARIYREAKVLDFGLAQTAQSTKLTRMGSTIGTITYVSPEQARSEEVDLQRTFGLWAQSLSKE